MLQAARNGRWTNQPPTGYDLRDGVLVANDDADTVRAIFKLRGEGLSQAEISRRVGINHSTVLSILRNRAYLGLVRCGDEWVNGLHDPLVTEQQFQAAHRGRRRGIGRGKDLMSGRVRCGQCGRSMSVMDNGAGWQGYRCWHRGKGCDVPRFRNTGLLQGAVLGVKLIREDDDLQAAIRQRLEHRREARRDSGVRQAQRRRQIGDIDRQRHKLFELYYADQITPESFHAEDVRLNNQLEALQGQREPEPTNDSIDQFDRVVTMLADLDWDVIWDSATDTERRTLLDEFLVRLDVYPDHLEVEVRGVPKLNVALHEAGLRNRSVEIDGVGGPT